MRIREIKEHASVLNKNSVSKIEDLSSQYENSNKASNIFWEKIQGNMIHFEDDLNAIKKSISSEKDVIQMSKEPSYIKVVTHMAAGAIIGTAISGFIYSFGSIRWIFMWLLITYKLNSCYHIVLVLDRVSL